MLAAALRRSAAVFSLLLLGVIATSQETSRWFDSTPEAKPYAELRDRLLTYAASVTGSGVPEVLFLERLKEGIRKRAPPERLATALEEEASRLIFLAKTVDASGLTKTREERTRLLEEGAVAFRASVTRDEFSEALNQVKASGGSGLRVGAVVLTLAATDPGRLVGKETRIDLIRAMAGTVVATERLDSLVAAFARGRSYGLHPEVIARIVAQTLWRGGNLAAVDEALNREGRRR